MVLEPVVMLAKATRSPPTYERLSQYAKYRTCRSMAIDGRRAGAALAIPMTRVHDLVAIRGSVPAYRCIAHRIVAELPALCDRGQTSELRYK